MGAGYAAIIIRREKDLLAHFEQMRTARHASPCALITMDHGIAPLYHAPNSTTCCHHCVGGECKPPNTFRTNLMASPCTTVPRSATNFVGDS